MKEGDKVIVKFGSVEGVIEKISTLRETFGIADDNVICFVRCQAWDNGTNGGRWLPLGAFKSIDKENTQ